MFNPALVFAFVAAAALPTVTPRVDNAMVLRTAATEGARSGIFAALGIRLAVWCGRARFPLAVPIGRTLRHPSVVRALDRITGGVFIAFGLKLAISRAA